MMTAIEMLKVAGFVVAALFTRAALVVGFMMAVSAPIVLFAYTVKAAEGFWHRHHGFRPAHHHS